MPGHTCSVCGNNRSRDPSASFHRFPSDQDRRARWLTIFGIEESQLRPQSRVCSWHFPDGDAQREPEATIGKRFASPITGNLPRAKRAKARDVSKEVAEIRRSVSPFRLGRPATPVEKSLLPSPLEAAVPELSSDGGGMSNSTSTSALIARQSSEVLVNTALFARIESLEAENSHLKSINSKPQYFRIEQIQNDDHLIRFYTGFVSYIIFVSFFEFLGPVVNALNYWGSKEHSRQRHYSRKLDPKNQFFLLEYELVHIQTKVSKKSK